MLLNYSIRRLLLAVITLFGASLITFLIVRVTGDPATFVLGEEAPAEAYEAFYQRHGLDLPLPVQYIAFVTGIFRGDLGTSVRYNQPVLRLFSERIWATLELGITAYFISILLGVSVGVYSSVRAGYFLDKCSRFFVLFGQAIPGFYLGLMLIVIFAGGLRLFPTGGRGSLHHLVLPAITLSAYLTAVVLRFTRSIMLDVLHQDYIRTARSKGLSEGVVIMGHALRNAFIPLLTIIGIQSKVVFTGAVVTETVFSWPGVGRLAVQAINTRDFPVIQGTVFIITCLVIGVNLLVDLTYGYLDPRIKFD